MKEQRRFCLHIVSPVHIGCDEVYEPTEFVIDEKARKLIPFDPIDFIKGLDTSGKQKLVEICRKGNVSSILELYKFMRGKKAAGKTVSICQGLVDHYEQTLAISANNAKRIQQELNRFVIDRTAFHPNTGRPYIPGSAIKGSLRTAYLNKQAKQKNVPFPSGKDASKKLEKLLLNGGSFSTDPFRMLKVSDFMPVGEVRTRIVYAINKKKIPSRFEASGPYQILEVIEPGAIFEGWISIEKPEDKAGITNPLTFTSLLDGAISFYMGEMARETRELQEAGLEPLAVNKKEQSFLLRLGRHSGAESVTIEKYRKIRIMQGKGQKQKVFKHGATTFWLASDSRKSNAKNGVSPFGWAIVEPMTEEMAKKTEQTEHEYRKSESIAFKQRKEAETKARREMKLVRQREEEERQQREAEEQRRQEAEAKRRAEWETMSPEERDIARLSMPDVSDEEVGAIFNRIDSFSPEKKIEVARKIKEWRIKKNIWTGQKKAQLKKVRKIKQILGEA